MAAKKKAAKKSLTKKVTAEFIPADEAEAIKGSKFSEREDLFCIAYTGEARFNAAKAARLAGLSPDSSMQAGYQQKQKPWIRKRIQLLQQQIAADLKMTPDDIEAEWGAIARFDYRNMFATNGRLLDPSEVDDVTARAISGIKVRQEFEGSGEDREHVADVIEVKVVDKNVALANYARALGMYKDTIVVDPSEPLRRILEAIDGATLGPPAQRSGA